MGDDALSLQDLFGLVGELFHSRRPGPPDGVYPVQGGQGHHHLDGSGAGAGDDPLVVLQVFQVYLRDHQGDPGLHAVCSRLVYYHRSVLYSGWGETAAGFVAGSEEDQVQTAQGGGGELLHLYLLVVEEELLAGGAVGGQELKRSKGELPFLKEL